MTGFCAFLQQSKRTIKKMNTPINQILKISEDIVDGEIDFFLGNYLIAPKRAFFIDQLTQSLKILVLLSRIQKYSS
jgi:hypothetical protein